MTPDQFEQGLRLVEALQHEAPGMRSRVLQALEDDWLASLREDAPGPKVEERDDATSTPGRCTYLTGLAGSTAEEDEYRCDKPYGHEQKGDALHSSPWLRRHLDTGREHGHTLPREG